MSDAFEEWLNSEAGTGPHTPKSAARAAFEAGRRAGLEEAAAECSTKCNEGCEARIDAIATPKEREP